MSSFCAWANCDAGLYVRPLAATRGRSMLSRVVPLARRRGDLSPQRSARLLSPRSTLPSLSTRARRPFRTRVRARATWSAREAVPPLVSSSGAPLAEAISLVALRSRGATSARALLHSTAAMCRDRLIALSQCVCGESTAGGNVQGAVCGRSKTAPRALRTASVARRLHEASVRPLGRLKSLASLLQRFLVRTRAARFLRLRPAPSCKRSAPPGP